jgi:hypothetical protein
MASWFPMKVFRRMQKEHLQKLEQNTNLVTGDYNVTDMNDAPWGYKFR